ncbi:hypothetical protein SPHINGO361_100389 [Sphingomonas sp. EC-HK361]|nr:hypothetical protein SPHINGO361_100389 [Sphingomonas sp. EC-HK361]
MCHALETWAPAFAGATLSQLLHNPVDHELHR